MKPERVRAITVFIASSIAVSGAGYASTASAADPLSARDIFLRQEAARSVREISADATLTTTGPSGDAKRKSFTWWRKLAADKVHFRTFARFRAPAEIRNEGILIEERDQNDNDVQLYLPAYKKIRRVEGQSQSSSFMGSVFSYSDIASPHVGDFKHTLLKSEPCPGEPTIACWVLELVPAGDVVRERTGYSRSVEWVRSDNYVAVRADLYDVAGALWKRLTASDVREVDASEPTHRFLALETRIEDLKTKRVSVLRFAQVKVNAGIADSIFTPQNLARED